MMKFRLERVLVGTVYAISGGILGASILHGNGGGFFPGAAFGAVSGVGWSRGKEFRHVWPAGLGFAAVGLIAALLELLIDPQSGYRTNEADQMIFQEYILSGWVCGSLFGTGILSQRRIVNSLQADLAGIAVGLLMFLVWYSFSLIIANKPEEGWVVVLFMFCSWISAIPGGIAGHMLFKMEENRDIARSRVSKVDPNKTLQLHINPVEELQKHHDGPEKEPEG